MRHISSKARLVVLFAAFLCVLSLGGLIGGVYFVLNQESSLRQIRVDTKRGRDERQQLAALDSLAKNTKEARARLASYIVQDQGVISFLALIESIARAHGATPNTQAIDTTPLAGETLFEELVVKISLSGSRLNIEKVIAQYENLPYQVRIGDVSLGTSGVQGGTANLTLIVTKMKP